MEIVKRVLALEETEKWYIEENDDLDDVLFQRISVLHPVSLEKMKSEGDEGDR